LGVILYTGKHTKMALNTRKPRSKTGIFDEEINYLSKLLFVIMSLLSLMIFLLSDNEFNKGSYILYFRYMLLLASIIPISMRVNLDFAKALFSY
jgi:phospholipid-translocating ATPase